VVGAAFFSFLELGLIDSPSAGPYLGTCLGETFLLEIVFLEGFFCVGGVYLELSLARAFPLPWAGVWAGETWGEPCSAGAFPVSLVGELSREETISLTSVGCCSEGPAGLEVLGVLWEASL